MTKTENIIIRPNPEDLFLTLKQLARYAGGSRYRMDKNMEKMVESIPDMAKELVSPAFIYTVHDASGLKNDLHKRVSFFETVNDISKIAVCICTLGPKLENEVGKMMQTGSSLEAVFLDAAGVGLLESLGNLSYFQICGEAEKYDLFAGCRLGPGYNQVPMDFQMDIFSMVDSNRIGVSLTDSMVMVPVKSLSFFVFFHNKTPAKTDGYKCSTCSLENCVYRTR